MNHIKLLGCASALVLAASATTAYAFVADGPYRVAGRTGLHASRHAHVAFHLPAGWKPVRGALQDTPLRGTYRRTTQVGEDACALTIVGEGHAAKRTPTLRRGWLYLGKNHRRSLSFRVERRGTAGARRWYLGHTKGMSVGAAYEPAPAAAPGARWAVYSLQLGVQALPAAGGTPSAALRARCVRVRNRLDVVPREIKEIHVAAGAG